MDEILTVSLKCLECHLHPEWGDQNRLDVFNRLLAKYLKQSDHTMNTHTNVREQQIESRKEVWSTDKLGKLKRFHNSEAGVDVKCPIILAEYMGLYALDGNHRINRWVANKDTRQHPVHIHTITGPIDFTEKPSIDT
jgi:hypothetical protein